MGFQLNKLGKISSVMLKKRSVNLMKGSLKEKWIFWRDLELGVDRDDARYVIFARISFDERCTESRLTPGGIFIERHIRPRF